MKKVKNYLLMLIAYALFTGCKLNNRVKVLTIHSEFISVDTLANDQGCFTYSTFSDSLGKPMIGIWFEIEYVSDGTKSKKMFSAPVEGGDGAIQTIDYLKVFLVDSLGAKLEITDQLWNDSTFYLHKLSDRIQLKINNEKSIKVQCNNEGQYNCYCSVSNIYKTPQLFVTNFNQKEKTTCFEELKYPIFWNINENVIRQANYKTLVTEIKFSDGKIISSEVAIE